MNPPPVEPPPLAQADDRRATLKAGRAVGLLASEIASGRMSLGVALDTAALSPDFSLDADELDYLRDRLRAEFATDPAPRRARVFRVRLT